MLKGQQIAASVDAQSVPIHASAAGTLHYSEQPDPRLLMIETDHQNRAMNGSLLIEPEQQTPEQLIRCIGDAGITGMGGAGFPAHLKLTVALQKQPDTLIINAVECDPGAVCDSALFMEQLDQVLSGATLVISICAVKHCIIAIEADQTELFNRLSDAVSSRARAHFELIAIPAKYPSGSEQQLVQCCNPGSN